MSSAPKLPPPLREGDHLGREEFLRRWDAEPDLKHAELIDGTVCMSSPVGTPHGRFTSLIDGWLFVYAAATPVVYGASNRTWLMLQSAPQPDAELCLRPEFGGNSREEGRFVSGAPELAVEIVDTTTGHDLGPKLQLYLRAGVREVITVLLSKPQVIWRSLADSEYEQISLDADGLLRSRIFPGLWLDQDALLREDASTVMSAVLKGAGSTEHRAFVQRLTANRLP